jgi:bifunctional UDP-N-acetylglucosamine pyrophosphorylase/glucosamine-1-phosphate N-acetyltransferase
MNLQIVVLAAGKGKRMQSETPKVLSLLHGKPLVLHLLDTIKASGVCDDPIFVVGVGREQVMDTVGRQYRYAVQEEQLGTGHAVRMAQQLAGNADTILVLYGDMPYISPKTIQALAQVHEKSGAVLSMATVTVPDFEGVNAGFYDFSRVVRDADGHIVRTVEKKDASEDELCITEVNPAYFCFNAAWLWQKLALLSNTNAQGEYYLTDLVRMATEENLPIASVAIQPKEAMGVNTKEHLELLHTISS